MPLDKMNLRNSIVRVSTLRSAFEKGNANSKFPCQYDPSACSSFRFWSNHRPHILGTSGKEVKYGWFIGETSAALLISNFSWFPTTYLERLSRILVNTGTFCLLRTSWRTPSLFPDPQSVPESLTRSTAGSPSLYPYAGSIKHCKPIFELRAEWANAPNGPETRNVRDPLSSYGSVFSHKNDSVFAPAAWPEKREPSS